MSCTPWAGAFLANGVVIARTTLRLYALPDLSLVKELGTSRSPVITAAATSTDGARLAVMSDRGSLTIYDTSTLEIVREIKGHDASVPDTFAKDIAEIVFTRAGDLLVSAPLKNAPMGVTLHRF